MKSSLSDHALSGSTPVSDVARIEAKLDLMLAVLARIAVAVERLSGVPGRPNVGALLRAVFEAVADRVFAASEIIEFADAVGAEELRGEIVRAVGALNPRRLGKRFAAIEGEEHDGYRLRRVGSDRDGIAWQVVRVSESANPPSSVSARGIA